MGKRKLFISKNVGRRQKSGEDPNRASCEDFARKILRKFKFEEEGLYFATNRCRSSLTLSTAKAGRFLLPVMVHGSATHRWLPHPSSIAPSEQGVCHHPISTIIHKDGRLSEPSKGLRLV